MIKLCPITIDNAHNTRVGSIVRMQSDPDAPADSFSDAIVMSVTRSDDGSVELRLARPHAFRSVAGSVLLTYEEYTTHVRRAPARANHFLLAEVHHYNSEVSFPNRQL